MTDVLQSMIRLPWALSLFGLRQAGSVAAAMATARAPRRATDALDALTRAAEDQLGDGLADAYRTGDDWQQAAFDAGFRLAEPAFDLARRVASATVVRGSLGFLGESAAILEAAWPGASRTMWRDLRNKAIAFEHFQFVHPILGLASDAKLSKAIDKSDRLERFRRLWATEGLGYFHAERAWDGDQAPRDLFRRQALADLPSEVLIPVHTGAGLAMARRMLPALERHLPERDVGAALRHYLDLCERNARPGFAAAMIEALGLIVRNLAPGAVERVDRQLHEVAPQRVGTFWHGVGRGLYFAPTQAIPGTTWRAIDKARDEAPHEVGKLNAVAGLAWALALVNVRHPEVVEHLLDEHGDDLSEAEEVPFAHGVAAAIEIWYDFAGRDDHLDDFLGHKVEADDRALAERWRRLVIVPSTAAVDRRTAGEGPDLEALFSYRQSSEGA